MVSSEYIQAFYHEVTNNFSYEGYYSDFQYLATQPKVVGWSIPEDQSNGFIAPDAYNSSDIICHLGATNAQASAPVSAGGIVELQWTAWPSSHHGPVIGMSVLHLKYLS